MTFMCRGPQRSFGGQETIWLSDGFTGSHSVSSVALTATFHRRNFVEQRCSLKDRWFLKKPSFVHCVLHFRRGYSIPQR